MSTYKQYLDLAAERFSLAEKQFQEEKFHTASHLFINSAINYHNALCQKFLEQTPRHKPHSETSYFNELQDALDPEYQKYKDAYTLLMNYKSQADYGTTVSENIAKQIQRKAIAVKQIAEALL